MLGIIVDVLLAHEIFTCQRMSVYLHFTEEETEAQRGPVTLPKLIWACRSEGPGLSDFGPVHILP